MMAFIAHWKLGEAPGDQMHGLAAIDSIGGGLGAHDGVYDLDDAANILAILSPYGDDEGLHLRSSGIFGRGYVHTFSNISDLRLQGTMTVMFWFMKKLTDSLTNGTFVCSVGGNGETQDLNYQWGIDIRANGAIRFHWENGLGVDVDVISIPGIVSPRTTFRHIACVRYEVVPGMYGVYFYVDGLLVDTQDNGGLGWAPPDGGVNTVMFIGRNVEGSSPIGYHVDSVYLCDSDESMNIPAIYAAEAPAFVPSVFNLSNTQYRTTRVLPHSVFNLSNTQYRTTRVLPHIPIHSGPRLLNTNAGFHK